MHGSLNFSLLSFGAIYDVLHALHLMMMTTLPEMC